MKAYKNLREKIIDKDNIRLAHINAKKDKSFYKEVQMVDANLDYYINEIHNMLKNKTYIIKPNDYKTSILLDKGKERELWKLKYYPHRIIQWAIMLQLEPIFMKVLCNHTCASLKGRGIHYAYNLTNKYLKDVNDTKYCLKIDIKKFYPSINHSTLKQLLRKKIADKNVLEILDMIIDSYPGTVGIPIGSYLSQYLANYYLAYFDHRLKEKLNIKYVVRYMDDIIILSNDKIVLWQYLQQIKIYLSNLKLTVKNNYQVFPVDIRGIDFVGYRFFRKYILLRKTTLKKMKKKINNIYKIKINKNKLLNYSEWCSINSYIGWIIHCDHYRLYNKYFLGLLKSMYKYYFFVISNKNIKKSKKYINNIINKRYKIF